MKNIFDTLSKNYILFENSIISVIIDNDDKLWLNSRELAKAIGYSDPKSAIKVHTDKDDRIQLKNINHSININQQLQTVYLSEAGLYKLVLRSKLDKTKKFVEWVTNIVLPSIRKFGYFKMKKVYENEKGNLLEKNNYLNEQTKKMKIDMKKTKYPEGALVYVIDYSDEDKNVEGIFRIGKTNNLKNRKLIYDTHMLHNKNVILKAHHSNPIQLETCLRSLLYDFRYKNRKDFYICSLKNIKKAFNKCIKSIDVMNQKGGTINYVNENTNKIIKLENKIQKMNKIINDM